MEFEKALENVWQMMSLKTWIYFIAFVSSQVVMNPHITALAFVGKTPAFKCEAVDGKAVKDDPCEGHCENYVYEKNFTSIVTEWDLVCDEAYKVSLAQEVLMFGFLVGVVLLGSGSDKMGRLRTMMLCVYIQIIMQLLMIVCNSYTMFALSRFFLGFAAGGYSIASYCIVIENTLPLHRALAGTIGMVTFALGNPVFALFAYFVRDWKMLSFFIGVLNLPFIVMPWFIPESPRWLMTKGSITEAEDALYRFGKMANPSFSRSLVTLTVSKTTDDSKQGGGTFDAFRTPELRRRMLALMFAWFTCSFVYYGLTMDSTNQGSNMYLSFALTGLVEVPAHCLCALVLNRIGRRQTLFLAFLTGGLSCLFVDMTTDSATGLMSPLTLSLIGKMGISMAFNAIYLFSVELLPTVIRNGAMGLCSMAARVGGIAAPILAGYGEMVTFMGFGTAGVISGLLMLSLPETLGTSLPETVKDVEHYEDDKSRTHADGTKVLVDT